MEEVAAGAVGIVEGVRRARHNFSGSQFATALETNGGVALLGITAKPDCEEKQQGQKIVNLFHGDFDISY